jgi:hypothetical protein
LAVCLFAGIWSGVVLVLASACCFRRRAPDPPRLSALLDPRCRIADASKSSLASKPSRPARNAHLYSVTDVSALCSRLTQCIYDKHACVETACSSTLIVQGLHELPINPAIGPWIWFRSGSTPARPAWTNVLTKDVTRRPGLGVARWNWNCPATQRIMHVLS